MNNYYLPPVGDKWSSRTDEIYIGKWYLSRDVNGNIWITDTETNEGGQFNESDLEDLVTKFFKENF
jgi:hypothetical protein